MSLFFFAASGGVGVLGGRDSLLHPPDARPRTPPRGLAGPLEPLPNLSAVNVASTVRSTHHAYDPVCEEPVVVAGDANTCLGCILRQMNHPTSATGMRYTLNTASQISRVANP
jgi:hypothetical protein